MEKMQISTIIPVYNAEKYLVRCLDSILKQGIEEQEIICVDDGSTDNSLKILRDYERMYDNIHVLTQRNSYAGVARNNGLLAAKGEYIHFMDADDYILPDTYAKVYEAAKMNSADYVKTRSRSFDMDTGTFFQDNYYSMDDFPESIFGKLCSLNDCREVLLKTARAPWASFIRRSYLIENNIRFNSLRCVNDHSFYIDVITHTDRIVICNCFMVCYQTNNKESLIGVRNENFMCLIKSYQLIKDIVSDMPEDLRKQILTFEFRVLVGGYAQLNITQRKKAADVLKSFLKNFSWSEVDGSFLTAPAMESMYELLNISVPDKCRIQDITVLKEIYEKLPRLILYGAGQVCQALIKYLKKENYDLNKISCILVSDKTHNPNHIMGIPVRSMEEYDLDSISGIIIATLEDAQTPIYQGLSLSVPCNLWAIASNLYVLIQGQS